MLLSRMTSDSPKKETSTIAEMIEHRSNLKPIWEYDWKTESVRQMPRTPMAISWYGIVLAMSCYPLVLGAFMVVFWTCTYGVQQFSPEMIFGAVAYAVVSFLFCAVCGMVMAIPAYLLLQVIGWISGGTISGRGASGVFGGLTGFLFSTGGGLFFIYPWMDAIQVLAYMGTASLLAIVMGYFGAIGVGYRYRFDGYPFFDSLFAVDRNFSIWSLLKLTTLVAVLTVILKALGPLGLSLGIAWAVYGVVQVLLLLGDHWYGCWMGWRKSNLQKI